MAQQNHPNQAAYQSYQSYPGYRPEEKQLAPASSPVQPTAYAGYGLRAMQPIILPLPEPKPSHVLRNVVVALIVLVLIGAGTLAYIILFRQLDPLFFLGR